MPRRHRNRKTMKGGFWDSLTQGLSSAWEKTKRATTDAYSSVTGSPSTNYQYVPPPSYQPMTNNYIRGGKTRRRGGKRTRKHRKH
jgi:hypothetical protein